MCALVDTVSSDWFYISLIMLSQKFIFYFHHKTAIKYILTNVKNIQYIAF